MTRLPAPSRVVFCISPPWASRCTVLPWLLLATMFICTPVPLEETLSEPAPFEMTAGVSAANAVPCVWTAGASLALVTLISTLL
ncbi:hypothetical protein D3C77_550550 [compost metagenome]